MDKSQINKWTNGQIGQIDKWTNAKSAKWQMDTWIGGRVVSRGERVVI
jgi:hypothetical protein